MNWIKKSRLLFFSAVLYYLCVEKIRAELEKCLLSEAGTVKLAGLNSSYIGFVQICRDDFWIPISYEDEEEWTKKNSIVTCKELGFLGAVRIMNREGSTPYQIQTSNDVSVSWHYYSVECTGLEERLIDCSWTIKNVRLQKKDVMVLCKNSVTNGDIAIVGINGQDSEGLVEIFTSAKNYKWSPVCSTAWDDADAAVACRQLGFSGGLSTFYKPDEIVRFKELPWKRYSHFDCSGDEDRLTGCNYEGPYPYKCQSTHYAGVMCTEQSEDDTVLQLHIGLLVLIIIISLLLIVILIVLLRCTISKFGRKPSSNRQRIDDNEEQSYNCPSNIVHTELDLDNPYAPLFSLAPPSYAQTVLADEMIQSSLADNTSEGGERSSPPLSEDRESEDCSANNMISSSLPPIA